MELTQRAIEGQRGLNTEQYRYLLSHTFGNYFGLTPEEFAAGSYCR